MNRRRRSLVLALAAGATGAGGALAALPPVLDRAAVSTSLARGAVLLAAARAGSRLVVGGERGIVLYSDDDGATWQQAAVPVQVSLTSLSFADAQHGWATGHFGVLLRTQDGGARWQRMMDGTRAAELLLNEASDDSQRAVAQRRLKEGADKPFFDIALAGGRWLAVGAYGIALQTRDGQAFHGLTPRLPNPRQLHLYGIRAAGERVFIVGEQGLLLRSVDSGESFEALPSPYKGSLFGLHLTAAGSVIAFGLRGNVWRSADHGEHWTQVPMPHPVSVSAATALPGGGFALVTQNGELLVSRDDGATLSLAAQAQPFPAAALAATTGGELVVTGLRGLQRRPKV
ncbi:YCF48-related protein [Ideonella azotifigens]|uniref:YCF48-related protein n=2 Tax=Ideonella azotifigens TaxID=513160 RepID=A0ABN1JIY3_9BURK|nr:YCF48-related protein [Ideonella azotifigens]MCD2342017.1 YCF48-related protein [Ideonella azotifigens]